MEDVFKCPMMFSGFASVGDLEAKNFHPPLVRYVRVNYAKEVKSIR